MKCPNCSFLNEDSHHFCGECGTSLISDSENPVIPTETVKLPPDIMVPGTVFAQRYRILGELGRGGMGRVFKVTDTKLREEIALKLIKPDAEADPQSVERFKNEVRAARQIVHKNVARVFDLNEEKGIPYITMEFVKGESLKLRINKAGRLNPHDAVRYARQISEGLAEAHRLGVVHRDLKPQNIMIDKEDKAKILDFGLARLQKTEAVTETGEVIATPAYIAPERVEGLPADGRADLYSLGIVLYEMVTGKMPFEGDSGYTLALKHVREMPKDPREINDEIPGTLSRIILKCLKKDRNDRYQTAEELIADLNRSDSGYITNDIAEPAPDRLLGGIWRWLKARRIPQMVVIPLLLIGGFVLIKEIIDRPGVFQKKSIAVLPVENLSANTEDESLCSGLQADITRYLSGILELRVAQLEFVNASNTSGMDNREICTRLGVDYLLTTTLSADGEDIEVNATLSDKSQEFILPLNYPLQRVNFVNIIYDLVEDVSQELSVHLSEDKLNSFKTRDPQTVEAYMHYFEGMRLTNDMYRSAFRPQDLDAAINEFKKAKDLEPNYALAYWALGNIYEAKYNYIGDRNNPEDLKQMQDYYAQAYERNSEIGETNLGLGWSFYNQEKIDSAFHWFKRALELDPNNPIVNKDVGAFLRSIGLYEQAIHFFSKALNSNPLYLSPRIQIAACQMCVGKFKKASRQFKRILKKDPDNLTALDLYASQLVMMNKTHKAEGQIKKALSILGNDPRAILTSQLLLWAAKGEKDRVLSSIPEDQKISIDTTYAYLLLGMKDKAIQNIQEGIDRGFQETGDYIYSYPCLEASPIFCEIRDDPRFQEILLLQERKYAKKLRLYNEW